MAPKSPTAHPLDRSDRVWCSRFIIRIRPLLEQTLSSLSHIRRFLRKVDELLHQSAVEPGRQEARADRAVECSADGSISTQKTEQAVWKGDLVADERACVAGRFHLRLPGVPDVYPGHPRAFWSKWDIRG